MIKYLKGDLFKSPAKILVNTVNTVGVMGKGVALEFKKQYPEMFYHYKALCEDRRLDIGNLFLWRNDEKWVLLFPTKKHWKNPSKLEYIELGLKKFAENWDKLGADSIAFPRLGCGNGGLDWAEVKPLMEKYLKNIPLQIYVYVDNYTDPIPEHLQISEIEKWLNGESDLEGYEKFKLRLEKTLKNDNSILLDNGATAHMDINENDYILHTNQDYEIADEALCSFWNYVRDTGIICTEDIPEEYSLFASVMLLFMRKLRYVESVIVSDNGIHFDSKANAYQFIAE